MIFNRPVFLHSPPVRCYNSDRGSILVRPVHAERQSLSRRPACLHKDPTPSAHREELSRLRGAESFVDTKPNLTGPSCKELPGPGGVARYPDRVVWTLLPNMLIRSTAVAFLHVTNTALPRQLLSLSTLPIGSSLLS